MRPSASPPQHSPARARLFLLCSKTLTLDRPFLSPFPVASNARIGRVNLIKNPVFGHMSVEGNGLPGAMNHAVFLNRSDSGSVVNVDGKKRRAPIALAAQSIDPQLVGLHDTDITEYYFAPQPNVGKQIAIGRSVGGAILRDSKFDGPAAHSMFLQRGPHGNFIYRNQFTLPTCIPTPAPCAVVIMNGDDSYANLFERNVVIGGQIGFMLGGSGGNEGAMNVVRGNVIDGAGIGVRVTQQTHDVTVQGNVIRNHTVAGVYVENSDRTQILGNVFGASTAPAVKIVSGQGYVIDGNVTSGGAIQEPGTGTVGENL